MVDKINVEIALEGGAEVERQLEDIGQAGQRAFGDIQNAADGIDLSSAADQFQNIQEAVKSAKALEQVVQVFKRVEAGFDALGNAANKFGARLTRSLGPIGVFARALGPLGIALGVVGGAFVKFGDDAADSLNALTAAAAKLGQTPQQLDRLQKALTQAGIAPDAITAGLQKFKETLDQEFFPQDLTIGLQNFITQLERMPDGVARTQLAMAQLGDALGAQVIAGLQSGTISAQNFATALAGITPVTQEQINQAAQYQTALNQMTAAWTQFKAEIVAPLATPVFQFLTRELQIFRQNVRSFISDIQAIWSALQAIDQFSLSTLQSAWNGIVGAVRAAGAAINEFMQTLFGVGWDQFAQAAVTSWNQVIGAIQSAIQWLQRLLGVQQQAKTQSGFQPWNSSMGTGADPGFASGGMIGGRGSGTSDSNLAWVSRGEHIMPARAVAQPGVLSFLEALRRSGGNLRGVLDGMSRFALGGLVPRPLGAAGGGSMSHVTINFPGLAPVRGLRASAAVVEELQKAAALAQVRSGGRKPSRYS